MTSGLIEDLRCEEEKCQALKQKVSQLKGQISTMHLSFNAQLIDLQRQHQTQMTQMAEAKSQKLDFGSSDIIIQGYEGLLKKFKEKTEKISQLQAELKDLKAKK